MGAHSNNGVERNYHAPWSNWRLADDWPRSDQQPEPVRQDWLSGTLKVEVDGAYFSCTVDEDGTVTFINR